MRCILAGFEAVHLDVERLSLYKSNVNVRQIGFKHCFTGLEMSHQGFQMPPHPYQTIPLQQINAPPPQPQGWAGQMNQNAPNTTNANASTQVYHPPAPAPAANNNPTPPTATPVISTAAGGWLSKVPVWLQWLIGTVLAIIALVFAIVGFVYAYDSYELGEWSSEKDYLASCQSQQVIHLFFPLIIY